MKTLSERLASLMKTGENQFEFATRIGVTQAAISRYLRNQQPNLKCLIKIVEATGVSVDWLLTGKEAEMPQDVDGIISDMGSSKTRPTEDKDWTEIMLSYYDKIESLTSEERGYVKDIIRKFVEDVDRRIDLIEFWNYLRFREKNPTMPVPKRKRKI